MCVPPHSPVSPQCSPNASDGVWLFDIAKDPFELCNLVTLTLAPTLTLTLTRTLTP